jgi:hypothetical protein
MMSCVNVAQQQPEDRVDGDIQGKDVKMPGGTSLMAYEMVSLRCWHLNSHNELQ